MSDLGTTAGILLREHDNIEQAIRYAERKAQYLAAMGNAVGCDYALAAEQLKAYQAKQGEQT
jgi:hypothetical protein